MITGVNCDDVVTAAIDEIKNVTAVAAVAVKAQETDAPPISSISSAAAAANDEQQRVGSASGLSAIGLLHMNCWNSSLLELLTTIG